MIETGGGLMSAYTDLARELLAKEKRKNIVIEVFDHFSVNCINSNHLDSEKLDALIKAFDQQPVKQSAPQLCRLSAEQSIGNTEFRI